MKSGIVLVAGFLSVVIGFAISINAAGDLKSKAMLFAIASCLLMVRWQRAPSRLLETLIAINTAFVAIGALGYISDPTQRWVLLTLTTAMVMALGGLVYVLICGLRDRRYKRG